MYSGPSFRLSLACSAAILRAVASDSSIYEGCNPAENEGWGCCPGYIPLTSHGSDHDGCSSGGSSDGHAD
jgi:hypothetical protein